MKLGKVKRKAKEAKSGNKDKDGRRPGGETAPTGPVALPVAEIKGAQRVPSGDLPTAIISVTLDLWPCQCMSHCSQLRLHCFASSPSLTPSRWLMFSIKVKLH